jgi:hypothetical protein
VANKISVIDERKSDFGNHSILEETERLKSIKMTPIRINYS